MHPLLGHSCHFTIVRIDANAAWLQPDTPQKVPEVPLALAEMPAAARVGDKLRGFIHLDSKDTPLATLRVPLVTLGEVAFLRVIDEAKMGHFVGWGLAKDLLLPHAEQTEAAEVGQSYFVSPYIDDSGRLAATMRVSSLLSAGGGFALRAWVPGVAYRDDPKIGLFVILARRFIALLPAAEPHGLAIGQAAEFRISRILPDGKREVSLRKIAAEAAGDDAEKLYAYVLANPQRPLGDDTDPEWIRRELGISKKAFKRAAAVLLHQKRLQLDGQRHLKIRAA